MAGEEVIINEGFQAADDRALNGTLPLHIAGKAGTGKSTWLRRFVKENPGGTAVVAPTGNAALLVDGETIHRFFGFPNDINPEDAAKMDSYGNKREVYKNLKNLVIDEVSMVRADMMDSIDAFLRKNGPNPGQAFGGVRMVLVGDCHQLPPILDDGDKEVFEQSYESPYFISAKSIERTGLEIVQLDEVFRQENGEYLEILNDMRDGTLNEGQRQDLNMRCLPGEIDEVMKPRKIGEDRDLVMCVATTNAIADEMNTERLDSLEGEQETSTSFGYNFKKPYPVPEYLSYKVGAQIMMANNDQDMRWVNGSVGMIEEVLGSRENPSVMVRLDNPPTGKEALVKVDVHTWEQKKYVMQDGRLEKETAGQFRQLPFRLGWAVTIHRAQGQEFPKVVIHLGNGAFSDGQAYVAFGRAQSMEGIWLVNPLQMASVTTNPFVSNFFKKHVKEPGQSSVIVPPKAAVESSSERKLPSHAEMRDRQERQQDLWAYGDEMEDIRKSWIADAVLGHAHCSAEPRPANASKEQDVWDAHYFAKSLSLEMFLSPKQCMVAVTSALGNRLQRIEQENPEKDIEKEVLVCDLQNVKAINSTPDRFKGGEMMQMVCQMETSIPCSDLPSNVVEKINSQLLEAGATPDFLIDSNSKDPIHHSFETTLNGPKIALEHKDDGGFQLLNRMEAARIYGSGSEGVPRDLTDDAVMEFIESHPWSEVRVSPRSNYFTAMKEAGMENMPLCKALEKVDGQMDSKLADAVIGAVRRLFLCHKVGVVTAEKVVRGEETYYRENFGRMALYVNRAVMNGKYQSGILAGYRKTLDMVSSGKKNPGMYLGPNGVLDSNMPRQWHRTAAGFMSGAIVYSTSKTRDSDSLYRSMSATQAYRKLRSDDGANAAQSL